MNNQSPEGGKEWVKKMLMELANDMRHDEYGGASTSQHIVSLFLQKRYPDFKQPPQGNEWSDEQMEDNYEQGCKRGWNECLAFYKIPENQKTMYEDHIPKTPSVHIVVQRALKKIEDAESPQAPSAGMEEGKSMWTNDPYVKKYCKDHSLSLMPCEEEYHLRACKDQLIKLKEQYGK